MESLESKITPSRGIVACVGDGEELTRSILELKSEGFSVSQYRSAELALREARRVSPVAFVMSGGREVTATCRRLRDDTKHAFTPVFVLSTSSVQDRLGALSAGADECGPFPVCYLGQAIQARRDRLGSLRALTTQDDVAGLLSHQGIKDILPREIARSARYRWPLCVAFVDIDHLASWNEAHGQSSGDSLLSAVVESFRYGLRDADVVARVGGDEFVLLLPHADANGAQSALERCRQLLLAIPIIGNAKASFSVGLSQLRDGERDGRALLERAIAGLSLAKQRGGNCLVYQPYIEAAS